MTAPANIGNDTPLLLAVPLAFPAPLSGFAKMPIRIQRKRTRGWRMPPNTVSVTRPGPWGNPFRIGGYFRVNAGAFAWLEARPDIGAADHQFTKIETAEQAVEFFRRYAMQRKPGHFEPLRGKDLACWCPLTNPDGSPHPCHADVLLELANK